MTLQSASVRRVAIALLLAVACIPLGAQTRRAPRKPASKPAPATAKPAPTPAPARPRVERPVPFRAGEVLTYDVSWSTYLTAGEATMSVKEKRPSFDSVAYYIVGEGRPTPLLSKLYSLYYKADTLLDSYTLLPQRGSLYSEEGKRRRMKITRFDHAARTAEYEVRTASIVKKSVALAPYTQDVLSAVYVLRAIPLKENTKLAMPVCDGGSNYRLTFNIGRVEPVKSGIGTVSAFRVTPVITDAAGKPVGRNLLLWITSDARRLPVRLQAEIAVGSFNLTLREVKP